MALACRLCLKIISSASFKCHELLKSTTTDKISIIDKLTDCIPELVLESLDNNIICESCFMELENAYAFKEKCIDIQYKIYGYLQQMPVGTELNVYEIAMYYSRLKAIENCSSENHVDVDPVIDSDLDLNTTKDDLQKSLMLENILSSEDDVSELDQVKETSPIVETNVSRKTKRTNQPQSAVGTEISLYECSMCEFVCLTVSGFRVHTILHKDEIPPYKCDECTSFLSGKNELLEHIAQHTNETPYVCKHCDYVTASQINYIKHKYSHNKTKVFHKCEECNLKFKSNEKLNVDDVEAHSRKKRLVYCGYCKYVCTNEDKIQVHIESEHKDGVKRFPRFKCRYCSMEYDNLGQLKFHVKWHLDSIKDDHTTCRICWLRCQTFHNLKLHIQTVHEATLGNNYTHTY